MASIPTGAFMSPHTHLLIDSRGVAQLTLINAGSLNILGTTVINDLKCAVQSLSENPQVRVVIFRTSGSKAFIGGADLKEMKGLQRAQAEGFISGLRDLCEALRQCRATVVAQMQGWCLGGGLEVAAACDLRVASSQAHFAMPEVRMGIPSVIHAALLPALIGSGRARWLMLTGDAIDAQTALDWGLVNTVAEDEHLEQKTERMVQSLLASEPHALVQQKRLLNAWEQVAMGNSIPASIEAFGAAFDTGEPARAMHAFFARPRA